MVRSGLIAILLTFFMHQTVFAKEVSYTLEDRDRLIRVETKIEMIDKRFEMMEKRFEQIDRRFEQADNRLERLENVIMWGFGLIFTSMVALVGFVLWDRRSALAPAIRKAKELEEREELLERALKEYAKIEPRFADVLRSLKLL